MNQSPRAVDRRSWRFRVALDLPASRFETAPRAIDSSELWQDGAQKKHALCALYLNRQQDSTVVPRPPRRNYNGD